MITNAKHGFINGDSDENTILEGPNAGIRQVTLIRWIHRDTTTPDLTVERVDPTTLGTLDSRLPVRSPVTLTAGKDREWLAPVATLRPGESLVATLDAAYADNELPTVYYLTYVDLTNGVR